MKHRLTIPYGDELPAREGDLERFLRRAGWRRRAQTEYHLIPGSSLLEIDIQSDESPAWVRVFSGNRLVYDDVEQSVGVTLLAEPQDAVPPRPEDERPRIGLTDLFRPDRDERRGPAPTARRP